MICYFAVICCECEGNFSPRMQGQKNPAQAAIDSKAKLQKDLDFSFLDLGFTHEVLDEGIEPREVGLKPEKPKKNSEGKFDTKVVRLNNNKLAEIKDLMAVFAQFIMEPTDITWLDLSFNELRSIDAVS